jgi:hypothetical protein
MTLIIHSLKYKIELKLVENTSRIFWKGILIAVHLYL